MKVAVIGTGYVGLVTGTCLAELGHHIVCIDIDEQKVASMQRGEVPIYEPDLDKIFLRNIREKRLKFTTSIAAGVKNAQVIFLALPTPSGKNGSADLSYIRNVCRYLGPLIREYTVIVNKSTVPVGTAEKVKEYIAKETQTEFDVVSNPEFLREGFAVSDFLRPDRIVLGASTTHALNTMKKLYSPLTNQGIPLLIMNERSAEITKYAANSFLATKISFINEVANLCELVGADVDAVRQGIGSDERIGSRFLFPGIGYGGSCFPKDVKALKYTANEYKYNFRILTAVEDVNSWQKHILLTKVLKYYNHNINKKKFAVWGLAFKPDTDDIREAPALQLIVDLTAKGASVVAYDPEAMPNVRKILGKYSGLNFAETEYAALDDADALLIATEWHQFKVVDFSVLKKKLKEPVIFDGRNIYDLSIMKDEGFHYESIGRRVIHAQ